MTTRGKYRVPLDGHGACPSLSRARNDGICSGDPLVRTGFQIILGRTSAVLESGGLARAEPQHERRALASEQICGFSLQKYEIDLLLSDSRSKCSTWNIFSSLLPSIQNVPRETSCASRKLSVTFALLSGGSIWRESLPSPIKRAVS